MPPPTWTPHSAPPSNKPAGAACLSSRGRGLLASSPSREGTHTTRRRGKNNWTQCREPALPQQTAGWEGGRRRVPAQLLPASPGIPLLDGTPTQDLPASAPAARTQSCAPRIPGWIWPSAHIFPPSLQFPDPDPEFLTLTLAPRSPQPPPTSLGLNLCTQMLPAPAPPPKPPTRFPDCIPALLKPQSLDPAQCQPLGCRGSFPTPDPQACPAQTAPPGSPVARLNLFKLQGTRPPPVPLSAPSPAIPEMVPWWAPRPPRCARGLGSTRTQVCFKGVICTVCVVRTTPQGRVQTPGGMRFI